MTTSSIIYQGNLRTEATHIQSGNSIITDAPLDNHGKGEAFSPTDLMATSLGSCMLTVMGIACKAHQIEGLDGTSVEITKIMGTEPRRVVKIVVKMNFKNRFSAHDQKILENTAKTCPVAKSLHPDIEQEITFIYPN